MNEIVIEWVDKAEGDFRTAEREARVRNAPSYDSVCFHRCPLLLLNDYAVDIRYPGESATSEEAQAAVKAMRTARSLMRSKLGLPQR